MTRVTLSAFEHFSFALKGNFIYPPLGSRIVKKDNSQLNSAPIGDVFFEGSFNHSVNVPMPMPLFEPTKTTPKRDWKKILHILYQNIWAKHLTQKKVFVDKTKREREREREDEGEESKRERERSVCEREREREREGVMCVD